MSQSFVHSLALCLPLLACAAKQSPSSKPAAQASQASSTWTCPDSLRYAVTEATPTAPGKPWQAPTLWGRDTAATPKLHPALLLTLIRNQNKKADTSDKEFLEPNFPWVGDLNGDGRTDLIMKDGIGLSKETAILVNCGDQTYFPVFHEMADDIRVEEDPDSKRKWKRLRFDYWPVGSEESAVVLKRWDGKAYSTCCKYQGSVPPRRGCCP